MYIILLQEMLQTSYSWSRHETDCRSISVRSIFGEIRRQPFLWNSLFLTHVTCYEMHRRQCIWTCYRYVCAHTIINDTREFWRRKHYFLTEVTEKGKRFRKDDPTCIIIITVKCKRQMHKYRWPRIVILSRNFDAWRRQWRIA